MAKQHTVHEKRARESAPKKKRCNTWMAASVVLAVLLVFSIITHGFNLSAAKELPAKKVSDLTLDFINKAVLQGQAVATIDGIDEMKSQSCLYNLTLNIQGRSYETYVTRDASLLFPQAINMKATVPTSDSQQQPAAEIPKTDKPEVLLFTMAYCPYGNQAEQGIIPVIKALGSSVEIQPHYVIYANYKGGGPSYCLDKENKYCSMHGIAELNQDVRELCIYKYDKAKFWDYILKVDSDCNVGNIETCWETPAKSLGIDTERIKTCQQNEATALLANEVTLNNKYQVEGSPMLIINGAEYSGGRTSDAYKTSICSAFNTPPPGCSQKLSSNATAATGNCG